MSENTVIARSCQICDICHHRIEAGERCRLIRDDFWPEQIWFEHLRCPGEAPVTDAPDKSFLSLPKIASAY